MDYSLMAGECRMIFFTSCEESQTNERDTSKQVGESSQEVNKNRTSEPTMKLVFVLIYITNDNNFQTINTRSMHHFNVKNGFQ